MSPESAEVAAMVDRFPGDIRPRLRDALVRIAEVYVMSGTVLTPPAASAPDKEARGERFAALMLPLNDHEQELMMEALADLAKCLRETDEAPSKPPRRKRLPSNVVQLFLR